LKRFFTGLKKGNNKLFVFPFFLFLSYCCVKAGGPELLIVVDNLVNVFNISECSIKRYIFAKIKALKIFAPELTCC